MKIRSINHTEDYVMTKNHSFLEQQIATFGAALNGEINRNLST